MLRGCAADVSATRRLSSNLTSYLQGFRHTTKGGHLRPRQCINSCIACFPQRTPFQQLNENMIHNGAVDEPKELIHAILIADLRPASLSTVYEKFWLIITPHPRYQLFITDKRSWASPSHLEICQATPRHDGEPDYFPSSPSMQTHLAITPSGS